MNKAIQLNINPTTLIAVASSFSASLRILIKFMIGAIIATMQINFTLHLSSLLQHWKSIYLTSFVLMQKRYFRIYIGFSGVLFCGGYESIKSYIKGEEIIINSSNYSYLLSFAYSEKIQKLREICEEVHKNIFFEERIEKQYFLSHFDSNIIY